MRDARVAVGHAVDEGQHAAGGVHLERGHRTGELAGTYDCYESHCPQKIGEKNITCKTLCWDDYEVCLEEQDVQTCVLDDCRPAKDDCLISCLPD